MTVWGIAMMRDEVDVAYHTLMHMAEEGLDGILVADNLSVDGTRLELERAAADLAGSCEVIIDVDAEPGYYQSVKMTNLARRAAAAGAEWIVPFDADELWFARDRVGWVLEHLPGEVMVATAALFHHFATRIDPPGDNPFLTMAWHQPAAAPLHKVAFRWREGCWIRQGNHGVVYEDGLAEGGLAARAAPALTIRHFPYRTFEQFRNKAEKGAAAYAATTLPESEGAHWRQYGAILANLGDDGLREVWDTWYHHLAPVQAGLVHDPAPFRRWSKTTEPAPPADKEQP